jgi:hypothetical protein
MPNQSLQPFSPLRLKIVVGLGEKDNAYEMD